MQDTSFSSTVLIQLLRRVLDKLCKKSCFKMAVNNLPRVPEGLRDLMKIYTKEVLREKPANLYEFSADYFNKIAERRTQQKVIRYEPPQSYEIIMKNRMRQQVPLSMVYNIIPDSLTELIKKFIKAVLKENPPNLLLFAREYFQNLRDSHAAKIEYTKYVAYENLMQEKQSVTSAKKIKCECGRILGTKEEEIKTEIASLSAESSQNRFESVDIHESAQYLKAVYIIQKHCRKYLKRKREKSAKLPTEIKHIYHSQDYVNAIFVIQRQMRLYLKRKRAKSAALKSIESIKLYESARYMKAVHVIQRYCRRHLQRKALKKQTLSKVESAASQEHNVTLMTAALIIQRAFRRMVRARKSRKHINAELDQNDDINDNASEAASYTSASTALLSTESACEHLDFGGNNYEEGVHQQTIKEDEEVENDNTNHQKDHVTETIKSTGKSISYLANDIDKDSKETLRSKLEGDKLDGFFEQVNKMDAESKIERGKSLDDDFPIKTVVKRQVSNENIENQSETKVNSNNKSDDNVPADEMKKESQKINPSDIKSMDSVGGTQDKFNSTMLQNSKNVNSPIPVKEEQIQTLNISIDNQETTYLKPEQETEKETNQQAETAAVAELHSDSDQNNVVKMANQSESVPSKIVGKTTSSEKLPLKKTEAESESTSNENNSETGKTQFDREDIVANKEEDNSKETDNKQPENMEINSLQEVLKNIQVKDAKEEMQQDKTDVNTRSTAAESKNVDSELVFSPNHELIKLNSKKEHPIGSQTDVNHPSDENSISEIGDSIKIESVLPVEEDYKIMLTPQIVINSGSSSRTNDTTEIANVFLDTSENDVENKNSDQNVDSTETQKTKDAEESSLMPKQDSSNNPEIENVDDVIINEISEQSQVVSQTKTSEILSENINKKQIKENPNKDLSNLKQISLENGVNQQNQPDSSTDLKINTDQEKVPAILADSAQERVESLENLYSAQYLKAVYIIQKYCRKYLKRKLDNSHQGTTDSVSQEILNADKSLENKKPVKNDAANESKETESQTILSTEESQEPSEKVNNTNLGSFNKEESEYKAIVLNPTISHMKVQDEAVNEAGEMSTGPTKADISNIEGIESIQEYNPSSSANELSQLNQIKSLTKENKEGEKADIETSISSTQFDKQYTDDNKNVQEYHLTSSVSDLPVLKESKVISDLKGTPSSETKAEISSSVAEEPSKHKIIKHEESVENFKTSSDEKTNDEIVTDERSLLNETAEIADDENEIAKTILSEKQSNHKKSDNENEIDITRISGTLQELEADDTTQNDNDKKNPINKDESTRKTTESNQSLVEDKMGDVHVKPTSEISKERGPDSPSRDNKSTLLLSNQLIGTHIITPTKSKKLSSSKEKHSTTPSSSRLVNTPVAELQLKSFKTGSDSGAWYETHDDLNESIVDRNESNPAKRKAVSLPQSDVSNIQITERTAKYINGEQIETNEPKKEKQSIAYFISFDGNEGQTSYKKPAKFLRKPGSSLNENTKSIKSKEENSKSSKPKETNEIECEEAAKDLNYHQFGAQKLQTIQEINENESSSDIKGELDTSEDINRTNKGKETEGTVVISDVSHVEQNLIELIATESDALKEEKHIEKYSNKSNDLNRLRSVNIIQRAYRNYIARRNMNTDRNIERHESIQDLPNDSETQNLAAIKIQRIFKKYLERVAQKKSEPANYSNKKYSGSELLAVVQIQRTFRNYIRRQQKQPHCEDMSEDTSLLTVIPKNSSLTTSETSQSRGLISPTSDDLIIDSDSEPNSTKPEWFVGTQRILVEPSGTPVIESIETNTISDLFAPISESTNNTQSNGSHESKLATDIGSTLSELNAQEVYENDNGDSDNLAGSANEVVKDLIQDLTDTAFAKLDASREDNTSTRQFLNDFLVKEIEFSSKQESYSGKTDERDTQNIEEVHEDQCIKKTVSLNYPNQDEVENDTESKIKIEQTTIKHPKENPSEYKEKDILEKSGRVKSMENDADQENESISKERKKEDVDKVSVEDEESKANLSKVETESEVVLEKECKELIEIEKEKVSKEENEQVIEKDMETAKKDNEERAFEAKVHVKENEKMFKEAKDIEEEKYDIEEIAVEKVKKTEEEKEFNKVEDMEREKKDREEIVLAEKVTEIVIDAKEEEGDEILKEKIAFEEESITEKGKVNVGETEKGSKEAEYLEREKKDTQERVVAEEDVIEKEKVNVKENEESFKEAGDMERENIDEEVKVAENETVNSKENVKGFQEAREQVFEEENKVEKENPKEEENEKAINEQNETELKVVNEKEKLFIKENEIKDIIEKEEKLNNKYNDDDSFVVVDVIDEATSKLSMPDEIIEKMSQRQLSETREKHKDNYNITEPVFDEPVIRPMSSLQDQSSLDIEDGDIIVYNRLQREATRESSAQSESVVFGEDGDDDRVLSNDAETARTQLSRHYTIAGEDPHSIFRTVTIDDTVQYIEDRYGDEIAAVDSTNSFCLDDETSENIRKKIMAYSLSETDSDYFDPNKVINDDAHVDTAMTDMMDTSTETESTIVSAATKIQAGARGFLTRRRLRRASAGTKSSTQETKASFGNDAISESLERFIEEEAAKKIQSAYRLHSKNKQKQTKNVKSASLEGSLAAKRLTLQRGDALRNDSNSTPEDENSNSSKSGQKVAQAKLSKDNEKRSKIKSDYAVMWPGIRQNSMPVQIESEVLRVIPKHIRKRIKSAENGKKKY